MLTVDELEEERHQQRLVPPAHLAHRPLQLRAREFRAARRWSWRHWRLLLLALPLCLRRARRRCRRCLALGLCGGGSLGGSLLLFLAALLVGSRGGGLFLTFVLRFRFCRILRSLALRFCRSLGRPALCFCCSPGLPALRFCCSPGLLALRFCRSLRSPALCLCRSLGSPALCLCSSLVRAAFCCSCSRGDRSLLAI